MAQVLTSLRHPVTVFLKSKSGREAEVCRSHPQNWLCSSYFHVGRLLGCGIGPDRTATARRQLLHSSHFY
jgi:hypothetical protein